MKCTFAPCTLCSPGGGLGLGRHALREHQQEDGTVQSGPGREARTRLQLHQRTPRRMHSHPGAPAPHRGTDCGPPHPHCGSGGEQVSRVVTTVYRLQWGGDDGMMNLYVIIHITMHM